MMLGVEVGGAPYGGHVFEPGAAASVAVAVGLLAWGVARRRSEAAVGLLVACCLWGAHSGLGTLDSLFDGATAGQVAQQVPPDERIDQLYVDLAGVSSNLTGALAFHAGFDRTVTERTATTTLFWLESPDREKRSLWLTISFYEQQSFFKSQLSFTRMLLDVVC